MCKTNTGLEEFSHTPLTYLSYWQTTACPISAHGWKPWGNVISVSLSFWVVNRWAACLLRLL